MTVETGGAVGGPVAAGSTPVRLPDRHGSSTMVGIEATRNPAMLCSPLHRMEIRFDGVRSPGGLLTVNSARFGLTRDGGKRPHQGVDLYAVPGTPIHAVADGTIVQVRRLYPSYGNDILLRFAMPAAWLAVLARHGVVVADGVLFAHYAHLSAIGVAAGQQVRRGQRIGATGISGNADQRYPHLHFELRKVAAPGSGPMGQKNRVNPELVFTQIDYSRPVDVAQRMGRTA
jgi:murein DD-endopeptidase MepM/ murein hydrolase activator NlpD